MRRRLFSAFIVVVVLGVTVTPAGAQTPERTTLVNRLLDALDFDHTTLDLAFGTAPAQPAGLPAGPMANFLKKYITSEKVRPAVVKVYSEMFSESELTDVITFYESTVGKKWLKSEPVLIAAVRPVIAAIIQEHMDEFRRDVMGLPPAPAPPPLQ